MQIQQNSQLQVHRFSFPLSQIILKSLKINKQVFWNGLTASTGRQDSVQMKSSFYTVFFNHIILWSTKLLSVFWTFPCVQWCQISKYGVTIWQENWLTEGNSHRKLLKTMMKLQINREHDHSVCVIAQTEARFCCVEIADVEMIHDLCLHSPIGYRWSGHSMEAVLSSASWWFCDWTALSLLTRGFSGVRTVIHI